MARNKNNNNGIPLSLRVQSLNRLVLTSWLLLQPATGRIGNANFDINQSTNTNQNNTIASLTTKTAFATTKRRTQQVHNYCGTDWTTANSQCTTPCPDGESTWCGEGESCFADVTSCPGMIVSGGSSAEGFGDHQTLGLGAGVAQPQAQAVPPAAAAYSGTAGLSSHCQSSPVSIGYYQSWSRYRTCHPVSPSSIPTSGLTHLIYSFAGITAGKLDAYDGITEEYGAYSEFNSLKSTGVKTLIAVGGWTFDQTLFTSVASTDESRSVFASSCVEFMSTHGFDGLDLDWEYPVSRQGSPQDYDNLVLLVQALRQAFGTEYLLTIAIPANVDKLSQGYDLLSLANEVDWFHLMSYDIHGSWDELAGSNTDMPYITQTVDYLLNFMDGNKLVLGMASYGRSVALNDAGCTTAGCPINGGAITGCSGELGFIPYFELKEKYIDGGAYESLLFNEVTGSMEMVVSEINGGGKVWISLDVEQSWKVKSDFALDRCLRGTMWWAIDMIKELPFTQAAPAAVLPEASASNTATPPTPLTPPVNAPGVDKNDAYCKGEDGLVPTENCEGFVFCANGKMSGSVVQCGPGLYFDVQMGICNWPSGTNLCGFEFCPEGYSGYVPFEECTKFYYCNAGKIDGDIDVCPSGTLFDEVSGICNWAANVVCSTRAPTPLPTVAATPGPTFASVVQTVSSPALSGVSNTVSTAAVVYPKTSPTTFGSVSAPSISENESMKTNQAETAMDETVASITIAEPDTSTVLRFDPSDDAYVQEARPRENWNDDYIVIDQNLRFDGLIRFFVQGIKGRKVNYAKLKLYVSQGSDFGGKFYACVPDWHEDIVTWDSAPSIIDEEPLAVVNTVEKDEWIEVDLTELITDDGPVAVRIISDSNDNVMYSSKENPNKNAPQLIVGLEPEGMQGKSMALNTLKIGPTDDAFVFKTASNKNYGRHRELKVDMDNGIKTTYLRFDFSRVNVHAIQNATLRLYVTDPSISGGTIVTTSDTEWNENSITFNNAPSADGIILSHLGEVFQDEWIEIDITDAITESGPLSICIMGSHEDKVSYSSKEGPHSPEITLELEESTPIEGERKVLMPTDDATIVLQQPDLNFGSGNTLETDLRDGMRSFLLRFDASDIPQGEVKNAFLRLYATNENPAFGGTFVEVMNSNWNEQTVTWNKAPSADGKVLGSLHEVEGGSWYDVDVTNAVIGGHPVSFRVSSPHSSTAVYGSKESSHKPKLIVQFSPSDPTPEDFDIFYPSDDASILMEHSQGNFGRDSQLKVDGNSGVYNTLLRFDLTSVEKGTISEAILRLYAVDGSPSGGTFISTSRTDWDQYRVNWDNAPSADGIVIATLGEVIPYSWYEIDVKEIALGGEPISIRIAPSHGNRCAYSSLEDPYGRKPQLLIKSDIFSDVE